MYICHNFLLYYYMQISVVTKLYGFMLFNLFLHKWYVLNYIISKDVGLHVTAEQYPLKTM